MPTIIRVSIVSCLLTALFATGATAAKIESGSVEFISDFAFQHANISDETGDNEGLTTADLSAGVGVFASSLFEIVGDLQLNHVSVGDASETSFGVTGGVLLNFATSSEEIPFVGARVGVLTHGGDTPFDATEGILPELVVGLRIPTRDVVSLNIFAGYRHVTNPLGVDEFTSNDIFIGFGVNVFLKGGAI